MLDYFKNYFQKSPKLGPYKHSKSIPKENGHCQYHKTLLLHSVFLVWFFRALTHLFSSFLQILCWVFHIGVKLFFFCKFQITIIGTGIYFRKKEISYNIHISLLLIIPFSFWITQSTEKETDCVWFKMFNKYPILALKHILRGPSAQNNLKSFVQIAFLF